VLPPVDAPIAPPEPGDPASLPFVEGVGPRPLRSGCGLRKQDAPSKPQKNNVGTKRTTKPPG
jgi:hypothetical protein